MKTYYATHSVTLDGKTFNSGEVVPEKYMNSPMAKKHTRLAGVPKKDEKAVEELNGKSLKTPAVESEDKEEKKEEDQLPEPTSTSDKEDDKKEETADVKTEGSTSGVQNIANPKEDNKKDEDKSDTSKADKKDSKK